MSKNSNGIPSERWIYFVFNWGSPVGCFTNVVNSAALYKLLYDRFSAAHPGEPLPEGAISVVRYVPAPDFYKARQQDITMSIYKMVCHG